MDVAKSQQIGASKEVECSGMFYDMMILVLYGQGVVTFIRSKLNQAIKKLFRAKSSDQGLFQISKIADQAAWRSDFKFF